MGIVTFGRFNKVRHGPVGVVGSAHPEDVDTGRVTASVSFSLPSAAFIVCGVTIAFRDSSMLDRPGDVESIRRQTNSGSVRQGGHNTVEDSGRRATSTR